MVNGASDVMLKLRDLLDREVERHDHEWMETKQRLTITGRTEKRPVTIQSRDVVRDCRSIVNQLVNSMPKDVLLRISYKEYREATNVQITEEDRVKSKSSVTRKVQFTEANEEYDMETRHCPGSHMLSVPDITTCPRSRIQGDQGTEFCPGSPEPSQTSWSIMM